jgi:hypothetical protein
MVSSETPSFKVVPTALQKPAIMVASQAKFEQQPTEYTQKSVAEIEHELRDLREHTSMTNLMESKVMFDADLLTDCRGLDEESQSCQQ